MKYVILQNQWGEKTAVCGFHPVSHSDLAASNASLGKPISAGFLHWTNRNAIAFGKSESLNLQAGEEDGALLTNLYYTSLNIGIKSL